MNRQKRNKIIISILVLIIGFTFSVFFSTIFHKLLSREINNLSFPKFEDCLKSLMSNQKHLKLFLSFLALSFLASIGFYFSDDKAYQSQLTKVTPMIYTPVKAGQNQHGSARWLTEKEKKEVFKSYTLNSSNSYIKDLIKKGEKDLNERGEENRAKRKKSEQ
ncbi:TRAG family protein [Proteiniborus sp. MB09-C3]|uniref:TRAG family protein n=1 Tax=Proteiniborus sp. MB09-C3 TaxID=3050072 RepID=UPI0025536990|nr:TRAG family protein [Proteiniborus sp. MB09-C3]WIV11163.1 TRAG family protein [Proteiniborus sp. MB09-C3]